MIDEREGNKGRVWVFTGLLAAFLILASVPDVIQHPAAVDLLTKHLGYPSYLLPFIGVAKLLGVAAILVPGHPRIKEWAYAGLVFDLIGALYSHIRVGDPPTGWIPALIGLILIGGSYAFYQRKLRGTSFSQPRHV